MRARGRLLLNLRHSLRREVAVLPPRGRRCRGERLPRCRRFRGLRLRLRRFRCGRPAMRRRPLAPRAGRLRCRPPIRLRRSLRPFRNSRPMPRHGPRWCRPLLRPWPDRQPSPPRACLTRRSSLRSSRPGMTAHRRPGGARRRPRTGCRRRPCRRCRTSPIFRPPLPRAWRASPASPANRASADRMSTGGRGFRLSLLAGAACSGCAVQAWPLSATRWEGSTPILARARMYFPSMSSSKRRLRSGGQCNQPLAWISLSSWPADQPA